ncbi:AAA family ATPase [Argonema antarcticum]|uniref:AAA family ATPase n=1 Tax=Argonema antarcticum TaxID=2942763 RepID=UPI00201366A0|nr:AAA family ATPase [Argonema antarcticum]MCL1472016.1 AAA family ATPase [Argonema antarcticum A004/B2]
MRTINDWLGLANRGIKIVGLEYYTTDRARILAQFYQWGQELQMRVLFWNSGYSCLQEVVIKDGKCILQNTDLQPNSNLTQFLLEKGGEGIYLLEGLLDFDESSDARLFQLANAYYHLSWSNTRQFWVMLENYIQLPMNLQPLIPVLTTPMPDRETVQRMVASFCTQNLLCEGKGNTSALVRACQGLPEGEIELVLERSLAFTSTLEELARLVLDHKVNKLRGRGLEFIAEPDVPDAGGLDLLDESLSKVASLLSPEAEKYGLKFPKGMILWGPPGTGKSLSAKLAAKKMGVPLLAADWGSLVGSPRPDLALRELLELTQALSPTILYWDDFDKGFAGWDSNADGGVSRRLSGKLLTWMQEHQYPIYIVATVNRLGMLPPELIRRFDDIFFVDLPHEGAMYEIFNLHLKKYFPEFRHPSVLPWTDDEWRILLRDYRLCTPAEIGNAVRKCAEEIYYRHQVEGKQPDELKVTLQDLRQQRYQFTPSMLRDEEQILAIRNQATYARSASGEDRSRFSIPLQELFG